MIAPNGRGGTAHARHGNRPRDVLHRGPLGRDVGFPAHAVVGWSAPLRPVIGNDGTGKDHNATRGKQRADGSRSLHGNVTSGMGFPYGASGEIRGRTLPDFSSRFIVK